MKDDDRQTTAVRTTSLADRIYVDDRDLAKLTPISRAEWQKMRCAKEGPPWRKIGRRVIYNLNEVIDWIEGQPGGR